MARILPPHATPPDDPEAARLEDTLARLPDAWTLITDRRIGGGDGPHVAWVLLHPEIGVALVDLAPAQPERAVGALRALLDGADPAYRDWERVPIVAVATTPEEGAAIGQRLADAFAAAPPCPAADPAWTDRVIGLLLSAEDAAMAPVRKRAPLEPELSWRPPRVGPETGDSAAGTLLEPELPWLQHGIGPEIEDSAAETPREPELSWQPRIEPDDAIDPRPPSPPPARHLPFAAAIAFLVLSGSTAAYLVMRTPPADNSGAVTLSVPASAPVPQAAPFASAEATLPPAPSAAQQDNPAPATPSAFAVAPPPSAPVAASPEPVASASPPPPEPVASSLPPKPEPPPPLPPPMPVATAPTPQPAPASTTATAARPPAEPAAVAPKPVVARRPARPARPARLRETSLTPPPRLTAAAPSRAVEPAPEEAGGPPIDATDLPPLPGAAGSPFQQAANRPLDADTPSPARYSGTPATGQPVALLPPVGPPAAMPVPAPGDPGGGALVGSQP